MFSFLRDSFETASGHGPPTLFMAFVAYVWLLWAAKAVHRDRDPVGVEEPQRILDRFDGV
jgi:hypothetical protein